MAGLTIEITVGENVTAALTRVIAAGLDMTPAMKAIAGHLADLAPCRAFAERHGVHLVEDAAHAVGLPDLGHYGEAAAFSFYGNKNMTTA